MVRFSMSVDILVLNFTHRCVIVISTDNPRGRQEGLPMRVAVIRWSPSKPESIISLGWLGIKKIREKNVVRQVDNRMV